MPFDSHVPKMELGTKQSKTKKEYDAYFSKEEGEEVNKVSF